MSTLNRRNMRVVFGVVLALTFSVSIARADWLVNSFHTNSVLRYDAGTGQFLGAFIPPSSGGLEGPNGIVCGPDGNIYVTSFTNASVLSVTTA